MRHPAGSPPGFGVPLAPETSRLLVPKPGPRAPAAGSPPAKPPPAPTAAIPNSRCDRTGAPTRRARSRSAAPTPSIASPLERSLVFGQSHRAVQQHCRCFVHSAIPPLRRCPGPTAPAPRSAYIAPNHLFRTSAKDGRTKLTHGSKPRGIRSRPPDARGMAIPRASARNLRRFAPKRTCKGARPSCAAVSIR